MALSGKHTALTRSRLDVWTSADKPNVNLASSIVRKTQICALRWLPADSIPAAPDDALGASKDEGKTPFQRSPARAERLRPEHAIEYMKSSTTVGDKAVIGQSFGPSWATHWFEITGDVPTHWLQSCLDTKNVSTSTSVARAEFPFDFDGYEVHLRFDCSSEALIFDENARPLQAFYGSDGGDRRDTFLLASLRPGACWDLQREKRENGNTEASVTADRSFRFFIEMACTQMFGVGTGSGWGGMGPTPSDPAKVFELRKAEIILVDRRAEMLHRDLCLIADMARFMSKKSVRSNEALSVANQIMNLCDLEDRESWIACRQIARDFLMLGQADAQSTTASSSDESATPLVHAAAHTSDVDPLRRAQHVITPIGHCHIDTAWLWCYEETIRKCARSWSSQLRLIEQYSCDKDDGRFMFAASQAQQFEWVKERYPLLFSEIVEAAKPDKGGFFVPCGGTWVEMDCNLPSGESLIRQFLYGQRFFKEHFGLHCREFWLPDTFGYAAQLPQICRLAEIDYFLTQKLSWSQFNKFPFHTFEWEGLDGTVIFTHFPPTDTYCAQGSVKETLFHVKNYKEKERSKQSLMLFGNGDGGGGPLPDMIERLSSMRNAAGGTLEARIQVSVGAPIGNTTEQQHCDDVDMSFAPGTTHLSRWFESLRANTTDVPRWVGELYFELHRGTYTSQANNKKWNRQAEFLLHDVELFASMATARCNQPYPYEVLNRCWKLVLLQQFHDVIPGSSVHEVYRDSDEHYAIVFESATGILLESLQALLGIRQANALTLLNGEFEAQQRSLAGMRYPSSARYARDGEQTSSPPVKARKRCVGSSPSPTPEPSVNSIASFDEGTQFLANALSWSRICVIKQRTGAHSIAAVPGSSIVTATSACEAIEARADGSASVTRTDDGTFVLENTFIVVTLDQAGRVTSLLDKRRSPARQVIAPGASGRAGNQFTLFDDVPMYWNAWDVDVYHLEKFKQVPSQKDDITTHGEIFSNDGVVAAVRFSFIINQRTGSTLTQLISLDCLSAQLRFDVSVDWRETHQFLKVEFPCAIRASRATFETQFGCLERPTHVNTSWDVSKFEVCGHKWCDFSEVDYGVALLNNCKYGMAVRADVLRLSLLRSPTAPDPDCDRGIHEFSYVLLPHRGGSPHSSDAEVVQRAYELNSPVRQIGWSGDTKPSNGASTLGGGGQAVYLSPQFQSSVIIESIKLSEDDASGLIVRLYECQGGHVSSCTLEVARNTFNVESVSACNILEVDITGRELDFDNSDEDSASTTFDLRPFEILTLYFKLRSKAS